MSDAAHALAIVVVGGRGVVEDVNAKLDAGYKSARKASIDAMSEIGSALVSITLVMMLVFIPVSFMPGTSGVFYQQFGLTMAIAIGFSAVNALTLSPALCAVFLKPGAHGDKGTAARVGEAVGAAATAMGQRYRKGLSLNIHPLLTLLFVIAAVTFMVLGWYSTEVAAWQLIVAVASAVLAVLGMFSPRFHRAFENGYNRLLKGYRVATKACARAAYIAFVAVVGAIALLVFLMGRTPTTLVPNEDTGLLFVMVSMPPGTSQERTMEAMEKVDGILTSMPEVQYSQLIQGYSFLAGQGASYGSIIVKLKDWKERDPKTQNSELLANKIMGIAHMAVKDGNVVAFAPPMISGYSVTNGFEIQLQDKTGGSINDFFAITQGFLAQLNQQPEIQMAYSTFNPTFPQYQVDIDAAKAKQAGISPSTILSTLQGYYGGMYISNFNRFGKIYRVMMQANPGSRVSPETLSSIKIRNGAEMASLSNFVTLTKTYGPDVLDRFNMFQSISVTGSPAPGYSSGDALAAITRVAGQTLPQGYGYEYSGMTREEAGTSGSATATIFGLCLLFVYLLLSAQYESYILPWAVLLSIPFGLMGTFVFALLFDVSNNIYLQIALIMLIGLLAKNAILIVEFALERRRTGMGITASAIDAAVARLRPILMTSLALIIGLLPMAMAHGVGANGNKALGVGSIGGMLIGMILQVLFVPALFIIFQKIQERFTPLQWKDTNNDAVESEIVQYTPLGNEAGPAADNND